MLVSLFLVFLFLWVRSSIAVDDLIKYQFDHFHDVWISDGKPRGMFFNPKNSSYASFCTVSFRLSWVGKPSWVGKDSNAENLYRKLEFWDKTSKYFIVVDRKSVV